MRNSQNQNKLLVTFIKKKRYCQITLPKRFTHLHSCHHFWWPAGVGGKWPAALGSRPNDWPQRNSAAWSIEVIQLWIEAYVVQRELYPGPGPPDDLCSMPLEADSEYRPLNLLSSGPRLLFMCWGLPRCKLSCCVRRQLCDGLWFRIGSWQKQKRQQPSEGQKF